MRGPVVQRPTVYAALTCSALLLTVTACGGAEARAPLDRSKPTTPGGVTAQAGSATSVHVMWSPAADDRGVAAYEVYEKGARVESVAAPDTMVDVERLAPSKAYSFTVRARDLAGNLSAPSAAVTARTPAAAPDDRTPPTTPAGLRGKVAGTGAVTLSWGRATDAGGVTAYDVYQEGSRIHSVRGTETATRVGGLRPGTVYTFTVRARDAAENSSPDSGSVDLTTAPAPGQGPSTAPTELTAAARTAGTGERTVVLSWTPPRTGGDVREYQLYLNGRFATTIAWGAAPPPGPATYTFTVTEPPGTRYSVKLRAKLPDGKWGDFSAARTVTTAR
ncbi:fibronectin type III domain-containing protein [Streptomyces sp. NPDC058657]|uniref:fibronectin type III domain-containing protein n=1 Tax=unclassified Streptomyces TaxID=2593676 RepID=UPI003667EB84